VGLTMAMDKKISRHEAALKTNQPWLVPAAS